MSLKMQLDACDIVKKDIANINIMIIIVNIIIVIILIDHQINFTKEYYRFNRTIRILHTKAG